MAERIEYERSPEAIDAGSIIAVSGDDGPADGTVVVSVEDSARGARIFIQNVSDTSVTLHLADESFAENEGIVLAAATDGSPGGHWLEERYGGVVRARHHGASGTKDLARSIW